MMTACRHTVPGPSAPGFLLSVVVGFLLLGGCGGAGEAGGDEAASGGTAGAASGTPEAPRPREGRATGRLEWPRLPRLRLDDFGPTAADLLCAFDWPETSGGASPLKPLSCEEVFDRAMARAARADRGRAAEAFLYDIPALVAYGMRDPRRSMLDGSPEERFALSAALLAPSANSGSGPLALLERGDPEQLRRRVLAALLERRGVDPHDRQAVGRGIVSLVEEADAFLAAEARSQAPRAEKFTDWALKTTTLTAFAAKIGMLTDRVCGWIARERRWPVRPDDALPERVLVVGPGIDLVNRHLGPRAPVATYQPIELALSLLRYRLVSLPADLGVDALDINPFVCEHIAGAVARAERGEPYPIALFAFARPSPLYRPQVTRYVRALLQPVVEREGAWMSGPQPGVSMETAAMAIEEARRSGRDPAAAIKPRAAIEMFAATLPPDLVESLRPMLGDLVSDRAAPRGCYALVLCTNVLRYYRDPNRSVALLNIRRMLRCGGLFVTTWSLGTRIGEAKLGFVLRRVEQEPGWDPQYVYEAVGEGF